MGTTAQIQKEHGLCCWESAEKQRGRGEGGNQTRNVRIIMAKKERGKGKEKSREIGYPIQLNSQFAVALRGERAKKGGRT